MDSVHLNEDVGLLIRSLPAEGYPLFTVR